MPRKRKKRPKRRPPEGTTTVSARVPTELAEVLDQVAKAIGKSRSATAAYVLGQLCAPAAGTELVAFTGGLPGALLTREPDGSARAVTLEGDPVVIGWADALAGLIAEGATIHVPVMKAE